MSLTDEPWPEPDPDARGSGQLPTADAARRPGHGVRVTWWFTVIPFVLFIVVIMAGTAWMQYIGVEQAGMVPGWLNVALAVAMGVCLLTACAASFLLRAGADGPQPSMAVLVGLSVPALVVAMVTALAPGAALTGAVPLYMMAVVITPLIASGARKVLVVAGFAVVALHWWVNTALTDVAVTDQVMRFVPVFVLLFAPAYLFSVWWWNIVVELEATRKTSNQLAVTRERLRFAADLHDIQGHHLQVIALKAELADRLLQRQAPEDLATARDNIQAVRTAARTALEETRSLVRDLREVSLPEELANARDVLEAAGATTTIDSRAVPGPSAQRLLGLAVREATTNILRHGQPTRVTIDLNRNANGSIHLQVRNNGASLASSDTSSGSRTESPGVPLASGTGLAGLARRFEHVGGEVNAEAQGDEFVLQAVLPAADSGDDKDIEQIREVIG